jgi:hypothetical protein
MAAPRSAAAWLARVSFMPATIYIYIDCGVNAVPPAGDVDIFVGWDQVCGNGNTRTGAIPLCHPLLKPYTAAECTSGNPRIFDYNTSKASGAGGYGGPLATNITIEDGKLNSGTTNGILLEGTVGALVTHINDPSMNPLATSGFLFANNNHLSVISYNSVSGPGCTGDTNFNAGEFTSSMNTITQNTAFITGVGCTSGQGEKVFGDSEGDEANHYSYNTATIQAGGSANPGLSSCDYAYNTWGETFDHENCTSAYTGFIDGPAGNSGQAGPTSVTNGTYVAANNDLTMQVPGDQAAGNIITETGGGIAIYLLGEAALSNNVIGLTTVATQFGALAIQSRVSGNSVYNSRSATMYLIARCVRWLHQRHVHRGSRHCATVRHVDNCSAGFQRFLGGYRFTRLRSEGRSEPGNSEQSRVNYQARNWCEVSRPATGHRCKH